MFFADVVVIFPLTVHNWTFQYHVEPIEHVFIVNGHQFIHVNWTIFIVLNVQDDVLEATESGFTYSLFEKTLII